jgi:pyridoxal phosphate enzyme (YggS family)
MIDTGAIRALSEAVKTISYSSVLGSKRALVLAASKSQPAALIETAIEAGLTHFGENKVQEAQAKWPALKIRYPQVKLHLIGPLQSNKAKDAVALFDVIQTVDRPKLADALAVAMHNAQKSVPCLIQVNTGKEPQKAGVMPEAADALIDYCLTQLHLPVTGLMCVPPDDQPPAPHFALLRAIALNHNLPELSMGMSNDFETALRMGSTCVRLGRSIFGERA